MIETPISGLNLPADPVGWSADYVGIAFVPNGRDRRVGLDCWGLARLVYSERFGIILAAHDGAFAERETAKDAAISEGFVPVSGPVKIGDLAEFSTAGQTHVGIVVGRGAILHALAGSDSCVERVGPNWERRFRGLFRYDGPVRVALRRSVLTGTPEHIEVPAGETIEEILARANVRSVPGVVVSISGVSVPRKAWSSVRPRPGRIVTVAIIPQGGGDSGNPLRIILTIAVVAAAIVAPFALGLTSSVALVGGGALAVPTALGSLVASGVGIAGLLAVNALIPPSSPRLDDLSGTNSISPTITGSRNQARPYNVIPKILGTHRIAPDYAAQPYTENVGSDQYLRTMFNFGYGLLALEDFKIGDTPVSSFSDVEIEVRRGRPNVNPPMRLYPGTIRELPLSVLLEASNGWTTRRSELDAEELAVDIAFPGGLFRVNSNGRRGALTVNVEIEYSPAGLNDWKSINQAAPDFSRGMDFLFRTPEVEFVAEGTEIPVAPSAIAFGPGTDRPIPPSLPGIGRSWEASGYIRLDQTGTYSFGLDSCDGSDFEIDGTTVVTRYGTRSGPVSVPPTAPPASGTFQVDSPGWYPFRVRVESRSNLPALALSWRAPDAGAWSLVPYTAIVGRFGQGPTYRFQTFSIDRYSSVLSTTSSTGDSIRKTKSWAVPRGQYDVRVRRTTPDFTNPLEIGATYWSALRTINSKDPVRMNGIARAALRIKATDQLNGVVDEFNAIATSIVPDFDATANRWIGRGTNNPASLYRYVLQGGASKRRLPDSRINLGALEDWHRFCVDQRLAFNAVYDTPRTVAEVLRDIAAAGRASPTIDGAGRHSVIIDRPQSTPRQLFTARNSRDFRGSVAFADRPHALRVGFIDQTAGYSRNERVVLADGHTIEGRDAFGVERPELPAATVFAPIEFFGVTDPDQVFRLARYYLANLALRPEIVELTTAAEHLACERGDLVLVQHDVPLWGVGNARVVGLVLDADDVLRGVRLDDPPILEAGRGYTIRFRLEDGSFVVRNILPPSQTGPVAVATFVSPIAPTDPRPEIGDLVAIGLIGSETRSMLIKSIEPGEDLAARLTLVDYAPGVYTADSEPIPTWDPGITRPTDYVSRPETPEIVEIRSDESVMLIGADGSLRPRMRITLRPQSGTRPLATLAQVRTRPVLPDGTPGGPFTVHAPRPLDTNAIDVLDVEEGLTYDVRLRTITPIGESSEWADARHTIIGRSGLPPDVATFAVDRLSDGTRRFSWTIPNPPVDLAGAVVRYGPEPVWSSMLPVHSGVWDASPQESSEPPAGTWFFGIRAIDSSGNLSATTRFVRVQLGSPPLADVIAAEDAGESGWPGLKYRCKVATGNVLEAVDLATWSSLVGVSWSDWTRWIRTPASPIWYEHTPIDLGFVAEFSPDADFEIEGQDPICLLAWSETGTVWTTESRDTARLRTVRARYLKAYLSASGSNASPVPVIRRLAIYARSRSVVWTLNDLSTASIDAERRIGEGDFRIPIPRDRFGAIRSVVLSFNGVGAGWTWELVDRDSTLGPRVRIFRSGVISDGVIDAIVSGYARASETTIPGGALPGPIAGGTIFSDARNSALIGFL